MFSLTITRIQEKLSAEFGIFAFFELRNTERKGFHGINQMTFCSC